MIDMKDTLLRSGRLKAPLFLLVILATVLVAVASCGGSPAFGRTFQGQIIEVTLIEMFNVQEVFGLAGEERTDRVTPPESGNELLVLHLRVDNHAATQLYMDVAAEPPELRTKDDSRYHPIELSDEIPYYFDRGDEAIPIPIIRGEYELDRSFGIEGWLVFDVPKGTSSNLRSFRWGAGGDVVFIEI